MGKINWNRVILGGLVAGVIINIFEFALHGTAEQCRSSLLTCVNYPVARFLRVPETNFLRSSLWQRVITASVRGKCAQLQ